MMPSREEFVAALATRHGEELQKRLGDARVAVCGLGGLGSNIAIALARAGVGHLHLIDFDCVDLSNLNRQQYFVSQLGMPKTEAMRENLRQIAPYCEVLTDQLRMTSANLTQLLANEQVVCEAFDSPEAKAMLVNGVLEHFPKTWLVAGNGMAGLEDANRIQTRRISSHFFLCGDGESDVKSCGSLFAARVMACA
ncbi:MAG: thiamine biosynthesis protein ThiF, partial [Victivallales bacterium]|nr:thiamine biosynthesis protein ThiF [Victivallales bacterium]